jgi:hypothetical protein
VPPPLFRDLKFQGYYAITLHHRGIALFSTPNCPPSVLAKAPTKFSTSLVGIVCLSFNLAQLSNFANYWVVKKNSSINPSPESATKKNFATPRVCGGGLPFTICWIR